MADSVSCIDQVCVCTDGHGDCDGDLTKNGCETLLDSAAEHCGACGHSCGASGCLDGRCTPESLLERTGFAGPLVFRDDVFFIDLTNGDLMSFPTSNPAALRTVRANPTPDECFGNLFVGPDEMLAVVVPNPNLGPPAILRVGADGSVTEPFAVIWGHHSNLGIAGTSDAFYYQDGGDILRVDRATLARSHVSTNAASMPRVLDDDLYFIEDESIMVVHPGGGPAVVAQAAAHGDCDVLPTHTGMAIENCMSATLRFVDLAGNTTGTLGEDVGVVPLDILERDGRLFFIEDSQNQIIGWDGVGPPELLAGSQPLPTGNVFRISAHKESLYWGTKNGFMRLVL